MIKHIFLLFNTYYYLINFVTIYDKCTEIDRINFDNRKCKLEKSDIWNYKDSILKKMK